MISLRVSEQEYESLQSLFRDRGARSMSDFARYAIDHTISEPPIDGRELHSVVRELSSRVDGLGQQLGRLLEILESKVVS